MLTAFVYFFNSLILAYFSWKVYCSIRKKKNPFLFYFFWVTFLFSLSLLVYTILISIYVSRGSTGNLLYWSDFWGRSLLYLGSVFAIQTPLYKFFPKSKKRLWASAIVALFGLTLIVYNLIVPNHPFIDNLGIIHWQANSTLAIGLAIIILGIWLPTSVVFLAEFMKSKFTSLKSFLLGSGFLIASLGGAFQDFGKVTFEYILINGLQMLGYLLIFLGLFQDEE